MAKGLTSAPLRRPAARTRESRSTVVAALQDSASPMTRVPFADIAPNPDNPPSRVTDGLDDLIGSIREVGYIQPATVVAAETFLALKPHHRDAVGGKPYVLLAGNRRWAAGQQAGETDLLVYVRTDPVSPDGAMLHENLHRRELTPLEEAQAFSRMMREEGLSQRQLADHARVPQSQISKRLTLLTLPAAVQTLLAEEKILITEALALAAAEGQVRDRVGQLLDDADNQGEIDLGRLTGQARRELAHEKRTETARQAARAEQAQVVEDPRQAWGSETRQRQLHSKAEIDAARQAGELAIAPDEDDENAVRYFRAGELPATPAPTRAEDRQRQDERDRKEANAARARALADIVTRPPAPAVMHEAVVAMVMDGVGLSSDLARVAIPLANAAGITELTAGGPDYWVWLRELPGLSKRDALVTAWVVSVAAKEYAARGPHSTWGARQAAYLDWLGTYGYAPTPWEADRLAKAAKATDSTESPADQVGEDR